MFNPRPFIIFALLTVQLIVLSCASGGGDVPIIEGDGGLDGQAGTAGSTAGAGGTGEMCGDGIINGSDQCDGENLAGETCKSLGEGSGTLSCDPVTCTFDVSMCVPDTPTGGTGGYGTGGTGTGGTGTGGTGTGGTGTGGTGTGGTGGP